jgi:hypothetical protein
MTTKKRTPEEVLAAIEKWGEEDDDADIERVLAMTPEQRAAELKAAGLDLKELDAQADAIRERLARASGGEPREPPRPAAPVRELRPPAPPRSVLLLAAAVAAAVSLAVSVPTALIVARSAAPAAPPQRPGAEPSPAVPPDQDHPLETSPPPPAATDSRPALGPDAAPPAPPAPGGRRP